MAPNNARSDGRSGNSLIAELAAREAPKADQLDARPAFDKTDAFHKHLEAGRARGEAPRLLDALPPTLVGSPETELVPGIRATPRCRYLASRWWTP
jgi:hypothetical protein